MDFKFPGVPKRFEHLGFLGQILVLAVLDVPLVHEWLEVRPILDAIRRVDVPHLPLPRHALLFEKRVHDKKRISGDEPVGPIVVVPIELDGVAKGWVLFRVLKEAQLLRALSVAFPDNLDDGPRVDSLMDMERDSRNREARVLGLASPLKRWVEVWVVSVGLLSRVLVGVGRDEAHGRVVLPLLAAVGRKPKMCQAAWDSSCSFSCTCGVGGCTLTPAFN